MDVQSPACHATGCLPRHCACLPHQCLCMFAAQPPSYYAAACPQHCLIKPLKARNYYCLPAAWQLACYTASCLQRCRLITPMPMFCSSSELQYFSLYSIIDCFFHLHKYFSLLLYLNVHFKYVIFLCYWYNGYAIFLSLSLSHFCPGVKLLQGSQSSLLKLLSQALGSNSVMLN